jgi:hypothetical protein
MSHNETQTQFELRTSRTLVAVFQTEAQAKLWLAPWETKEPKYAKTLKLFKVTTRTQLEAA